MILENTEIGAGATGANTIFLYRAEVVKLPARSLVTKEFVGLCGSSDRPVEIGRVSDPAR